MRFCLCFVHGHTSNLLGNSHTAKTGCCQRLLSNVSSVVVKCCQADMAGTGNTQGKLTPVIAIARRGYPLAGNRVSPGTTDGPLRITQDNGDKLRILFHSSDSAYCHRLPLPSLTTGAAPTRVSETSIEAMVLQIHTMCRIYATGSLRAS